MIIFDVGEREECVTVPVIVDTGVEMFSVSLEPVSEPGGKIVLSPSLATIEITDEVM